jgi:hypothetical protein
MKKTLIASAVAAATLATTSSVAFAEEAAGPNFYGNIQLAHFWNEQTLANGETDPSESDHEFADGGTTFGFTHEHMISEGLTGFLKAELEFEADDKGTSGGMDSLDEAYIGVKGSFGSVQIGSDDTVYETMINITDISEQIGLGQNAAGDDYAAATGTGSVEGDNVQYVGTFDAITVGVTRSIDDTAANFGTQLAGKFSADMFSVAAAYHMARDASTAAGTVKGQDAIGLAAEAYVGDLTLQLQYEMLDESESGQDDDADYTAVQAIYGLGASQFALGYGMLGFGDSALDDSDKLFVQALHNVSDNMYVYFEYADTSSVDGAKGVDNEQTAIGATYHF